jgi:hypothetical protein
MVNGCFCLNKSTELIIRASSTAHIHNFTAEQLSTEHAADLIPAFILD